MIEVNLLPGVGKRAKKGRGGAGFKLKMPQMGGVSADRWVVGSILVAVLVLGWIVWSFMGVRSDREEYQVALDEELQDSARWADLIARTQLLTG